MSKAPVECRLASESFLEPFVLLVGYGRGFDHMVKAGHYDYTDPRISAQGFPLRGSGVVAYWAKIFHFGGHLEMPKAVEKLKSDTSAPWEFNRIECLLAFGEKYPEEQRTYPIIVPEATTNLGEVTFSPYLCGDSRQRQLKLCWPGVCGPAAHFLGVSRRKPTP